MNIYNTIYEIKVVCSKISRFGPLGSIKNAAKHPYTLIYSQK